MQVADLITRAGDIVNDALNVRWPQAEWLRWLNDGQREIVLQVPGASIVTNAAIALVVGTKQTLPAGGIRLVDIIRNTSGPAVRIIDRNILDERIPAWHTSTGSQTIQLYCFDPRNPNTFYVYPPALAGASVDAVYSVEPADASLGGAITLPGIYGNALLDYMLYRAYSKDVEYAGSKSLAAAAYTAFLQSIELKVKVDAAADPNANAPPKPRRMA